MSIKPIIFCKVSHLAIFYIRRGNLHKEWGFFICINYEYFPQTSNLAITHWIKRLHTTFIFKCTWPSQQIKLKFLNFILLIKKLEPKRPQF